MKISFNKPYFTGKETKYIEDGVKSGKISGNGKYTKLCHHFFKENYGFDSLLTTSCTDALEMAALLLDINPGDEIIVPSYTFVSSALPFVMRGAKLVFVDSRKDHPGLDESQLYSLISNKTKAIVVVHYAGVACNMDEISHIAKTSNIRIIEDAAHSIDSYFITKSGRYLPLGSIGDFGTFSFHETKNIISGEGGMLVINERKFRKRAEIIWEKGTNRSAFFRGEIDKYGWVDIGSSFLPSEIIAAFLFAQLEELKKIQRRRTELWERYYTALEFLEKRGIAKRPTIPKYATNNGHLFYLLFHEEHKRDFMIRSLKKMGVHSVFHYLSLHKSKYYSSKHDGRDLPMADFYSKNLLRLPLYVELKNTEVDYVVDSIYKTIKSI